MEDGMTVPTARCKLNQLCWVKNAQVQSNIGRIVTTTLYLGYYEANANTNTIITDHYWNVQSSSSLTSIHGKEEHEVSLPDAWLQPILPDEDALKYVLRSEPQDESVVEYVKELVTTEKDFNHG